MKNNVEELRRLARMYRPAWNEEELDAYVESAITQLRADQERGIVEEDVGALGGWLVQQGYAEEQSGYGHVSGEELAEALLQHYRMFRRH